jgi:hypothetical protein
MGFARSGLIGEVPEFHSMEGTMTDRIIPSREEEEHVEPAHAPGTEEEREEHDLPDDDVNEDEEDVPAA